MPSILFVCTANRLRSPLAVAILKKYLLESGEKGEWQVASAGTWTAPGQPVISLLAPVAQSLGLDLGLHRSIQVDGQLLAAHDLILVMEPGHKEALQVEFPSLREHIYLLSDVVEGKKYAVPDTFQSEQQVTEVAMLLRSLIFTGYRRIRILATYLHNLREQVRDAQLH